MMYFFAVIFVCFVRGIANERIGLFLFALFLFAGYFTWALIDYLFLKPNRKRKEKLREIINRENYSIYKNTYLFLSTILKFISIAPSLKGINF